ncbi:hypothetical protein F4779DRAFT_577822 [Xylariaceae sp. FL0662B]|nr:hypothetical protein F4779DRAFT_577822 [Xylariaceae sp. FL0662B]
METPAIFEHGLIIMSKIEDLRAQWSQSCLLPIWGGIFEEPTFIPPTPLSRSVEISPQTSQACDETKKLPVTIRSSSNWPCRLIKITRHWITPEINSILMGRLSQNSSAISFEAGWLKMLWKQASRNASETPVTEIGCSPESGNFELNQDKKRCPFFVNTFGCPSTHRVPRLIEGVRNMPERASIVGRQSALPVESERSQDSDYTPSELSVDPSATGEITSASSAASHSTSFTPSIPSRLGEQQQNEAASASQYGETSMIANRKEQVPNSIKEPIQCRWPYQTLEHLTKTNGIIGSTPDRICNLTVNDQATSTLFPNALSTLPMGSQDDLSSHDAASCPARVNTAEIELCPFPDFQEDEDASDEEVDEYWTWDRKVQQFVHIDEDTGEKVYHPDEFD